MFIRLGELFLLHSKMYSGNSPNGTDGAAVHYGFAPDIALFTKQFILSDSTVIYAPIIPTFKESAKKVINLQHRNILL